MGAPLLAKANLDAWVARGLIASLFLFGGASRHDALSQIAVQLAGVLALCHELFRLDTSAWRRVALPFGLVAAATALIALQLLPLPPSLSASLPGHDTLAEELGGIGMGDRWRPLSLSPERTIGTLLGMLPLLAIPLVVARLREADELSLLTLTVGAVVVSGLIGAVQVASGGGYFYAITNEGSAVGLFANRNHQAALLACGLPMVACWMVWRRREPREQRMTVFLGVPVMAGIYPLLLIAGSRAGLALGALGTAAAALILLIGWRRMRIEDGSRRQMKLVIIAPFLIGALVSVAAVLLARDVAVQRLFAGERETVRQDLLPVFMRMAGDFSPLGSGAGTFEPLFRVYEPSTSLGPTYLNQAHNDFIQLLIEGGLPAALLATIGLMAISWRGLRTIFGRDPELPATRALACLAPILLLVAASAVDYPLRTPALGGMLVLFGTWLLMKRDVVPAETRRESRGLAANRTSGNQPLGSEAPL